MTNAYRQIIALATELDVPSTAQKIQELNRLLPGLDVSLAVADDLHTLDDLITVLHNTGNLLAEAQETILKRQEEIRSRMNKAN